MSVQYARRLQYEYDHETPQKRKAARKQAPLVDRSLIDDQEHAFNLSSAQDKAAAAAKLAKAQEAKAQEAKAQAAEQVEAQAKEAARKLEEAKQAEEVAPLTPAELRERRIKAFSKPTAN